MSLERRLLNIVLVFAAILTLGAVGYTLIEGWSPVDALYMAIITVTTVGFGELYPLSLAGRLFTSMLILLGVAAITYSFTALTNYLIAGEFGNILEGYRMNRQIKSLEGHYVICGFGRVGRQVSARLKQDGQALIVVDVDAAAVERARAEGYLALTGDAGEDEILLQARVQQATGLVAAVPGDAANLYVVLTARSLCPDLYIVARSDTETTDKLTRAGADRVLSPYSLGARLIAQTLVQPDVVDFLEAVMYDDSLHLFLEDLEVGATCSLTGQTMGDARIRETTGANVLGLKRGEDMVVSPNAATELESGDVLVALGTRQQLRSLADLVHSPEKV